MNRVELNCRPPHHIETLIASCETLNLQYRIVDDFSAQTLEVLKDGKAYIFGSGAICAFPINSATSTFLTRDKSHTINLLNQAGMRTAEGEYFFIQDAFKSHRGPGREKEDAQRYANTVGFPLFVKPNDGSRGAFVEKVFCVRDLQNYMDKHASQISCLRIEKPLVGDEHRLFVVDGKVWFGYKRRSPYITFNGTDSVEQHLLQVMTEQKETGHLSLSLDSSFVRETLKRHALGLKDVPTQGKTMPFSPAMNLAMGGEIQEYSEHFSQALHNYVHTIYRLFNLRVFGLDVYTASEINDISSLSILEINGNPSIESADKFSKTDVVHRLWTYVIEETFKQI